MTDMSPHPPAADFHALTDLWQSGGDVPVDDLIDKLKDQNRRLRRLNQLSFAICIVAIIFTAIMEFVGKIPTQGLLTVIGVAAFLGSWWKYRKDKARLVAAYSEEPGRLLPFLIKRVTAARNLGRYYYLVSVPSCAAGYFAARFLDPSNDAETASKGTLFILAGIGIVALVATTAWGLKLAREKSWELRELRAMEQELLKDS